jgi:CheY-like chemotaxis protein
MITRHAKNHHSYIILDNENSYSHNDKKNELQHYSSESSSSRHLQSQESNSNAAIREIERERRKEEPSSPFLKRILIVDDDPDITLTFKIGLEDDKSFEVYAYADPLEALSSFRPHFYDLLLVDINMPKMNGFELCSSILEIDVNVRICFITAGDTNIEALREIYPTLSIGCFIKKPVSINELIKRLKMELD